MGKQTLIKLESYKKRNDLTDRALADKLRLPSFVYLSRWRKSGRIIGAYERIVEDFLRRSKRRNKAK